MTTEGAVLLAREDFQWVEPALGYPREAAKNDVRKLLLNFKSSDW